MTVAIESDSFYRKCQLLYNVTLANSLHKVTVANLLYKMPVAITMCLQTRNLGKASLVGLTAEDVAYHSLPADAGPVIEENTNADCSVYKLHVRLLTSWYWHKATVDNYVICRVKT